MYCDVVLHEPYRSMKIYKLEHVSLKWNKKLLFLWILYLIDYPSSIAELACLVIICGLISLDFLLLMSDLNQSIWVGMQHFW